MTNDTLLESSYALILESAKKICKFATIEFFFAKSSQKKKCPKMIIYAFLKSP